MRTWDEEGGPHHRQRERKPFLLLAKPTRHSWWYRLGMGREEFVWGRYRTERDRDEALATMQKRERDSRYYEFRAAPTPESQEEGGP